MIRKGVILTIAGALLLASAAPAQQQQPSPPPQAPPQRQRPGAERCEAVLPRQAVEQILANYRERLRTARENLRREQRTLNELLVADATNRAALDAQFARVTAARTTLSRINLDMLWDLRAVIPAQDRTLAFRCAQRALLRGSR